MGPGGHRGGRPAGGRHCNFIAANSKSTCIFKYRGPLDLLIQFENIFQTLAQEVHHEDHEDEAAKAVRSILGHNDFEVQSEKLRIAHQHQQQQSGQPRNEAAEANNNKDATEVKRTSSRLRELVSQSPQIQQNRGLKRSAAATSVEIQYVAAAAAESKLDAPGE